MKFEVFLPQTFRYSRYFYLKYTGYAYEKVFYLNRKEVVIWMGRAWVCGLISMRAGARAL